MPLIVISVNKEDLPPHTDEQFEAWVKFCVGHVGSISMENPLHDIDMDGYVREIG